VLEKFNSCVSSLIFYEVGNVHQQELTKFTY